MQPHVHESWISVLGDIIWQFTHAGTKTKCQNVSHRVQNWHVMGWCEEHAVIVKSWINEFPVCLWNESLGNFFQVNIYQKPDKEIILYHFSLTSAWCLDKNKEGLNQCRVSTQKGTQRASIYWAACSVVGSFCRSTRCATVSCPVGSTDMARLAFPVFLVLCFSLLHSSSSRPPRIRKAVLPRQSGGNSTRHTQFSNNLHCIIAYLTFFFCLFTEMQLQMKRMWSPRLRGCGKKWTHWKRCRHCKQVQLSLLIGIISLGQYLSVIDNDDLVNTVVVLLLLVSYCTYDCGLN